MWIISSLYKNNFIPFAAVLMALFLCFPFLGAYSSRAKSPSPGKKAAAVSAVENDGKFEKAGLTDLQKANAGFVFDIRYATTNNFTGQKLYKQARCFLRTQTAAKLIQANRELKTLGYKIKIFDAYRPYCVQKILYAKLPNGDSGFIANPYSRGSNHNRGGAVDITLVRLDGSPVEMPTDFDTFSSRASIYYKGCSKKAMANRELLAEIMVKHGFRRLRCEWWHFDDTDVANFSIIDIAF